jgi:structural maintenance of chromosome 3 (chondroitin sulfate proteoglycan 6)
VQATNCFGSLKQRLAKEAEKLRKEIRTTTKKLDDLTPRYMTAVEEERAVNERIIDCERRVNDLYSKQGRSTRFTNKKERDAWIKKEIKLVDRTIEVQKQQIEDLQKEIDQIGGALAVASLSLTLLGCNSSDLRLR